MIYPVGYRVRPGTRPYFFFFSRSSLKASFFKPFHPSISGKFESYRSDSCARSERSGFYSVTKKDSALQIDQKCDSAENSKSERESSGYAGIKELTMSIGTT
jgi:hypothetical protein